MKRNVKSISEMRVDGSMYVSSTVGVGQCDRWPGRTKNRRVELEVWWWMNQSNNVAISSYVRTEMKLATGTRCKLIKLCCAPVVWVLPDKSIGCCQSGKFLQESETKVRLNPRIGEVKVKSDGSEWRCMEHQWFVAVRKSTNIMKSSWFDVLDVHTLANELMYYVSMHNNHEEKEELNWVKEWMNESNMLLFVMLFACNFPSLFLSQVVILHQPYTRYRPSLVYRSFLSTIWEFRVCMYYHKNHLWGA
jgi:hypothetical protein